MKKKVNWWMIAIVVLVVIIVAYIVYSYSTKGVLFSPSAPTSNYYCYKSNGTVVTCSAGQYCITGSCSSSAPPSYVNSYGCYSSRGVSQNCNNSQLCYNGACVNSVATCTDSDGGLNYNTMGSVYWSNYNYNDYCYNNATLYEYYCNNGSMNGQAYNCPSGYSCSDGACVSGYAVNVFGVTHYTHTADPVCAAAQIINKNNNNTILNEGVRVYIGQYVAVPKHLLKLISITNQTDYLHDAISFSDVNTGEVYNAVIFAEGSASLGIDEYQYSLEYSSPVDPAINEKSYVVVNYPQTTSKDIYSFFCDIYFRSDYSDLCGKIKYLTGRYNTTMTERDKVYLHQYVAIPYSQLGSDININPAYLLKLSSIANQSGTGYSSDAVSFTDVISGNIYNAVIVSKGSGILTLGELQFVVNYIWNTTISDRSYVTIDYPQTRGNDTMITYCN